MAEAGASPDPLLYLRDAIAAKKEPIATTSADLSARDVTDNYAQATHLQFNHDGHEALSLDTRTRFESSDETLDLRSVYFAWINKDKPISDYIAATSRLNEELGSLGKSEVRNLVFVEKSELIAWLEGGNEETELIRPLPAEEQARHAKSAAAVASGAAGVALTGNATAGQRLGKQIDPRLREIYNGERRMGDRNSVLRGIKPTDFSHVRKHAAAFLGRDRKSQDGARTAIASVPPGATPASNSSNPALVSSRSKPTRKIEPIILVSPSASSLLRMSNIKAFLDGGTYEPSDSASSHVNRLQISRLLPSIDPVRPIRFHLVDTPDMFKPDYWSRVAAVFTTGQTWQFKNYKWQSPPDLFSHALGIYVGWRGEQVPATVKGWGRGVLVTGIDHYNSQAPPNARWRDREVVEGIWTSIEESMKAKGMNKDGSLSMGR